MKNCHTKYPVLFVHGINCNDDVLFTWGRNLNELKKRGCKVYTGQTDAWGTIENNALQLKRKVEFILNETGCQKVNIIAHSKGGLDSRYMISVLGMDKYIVSLTTISTPHHGSKTADVWSKRKRLVKTAGFFCDRLWKIFGDNDPQFQNVINSLSPKNVKIFNDKCKNSPNVYYQSWGAVLGSSKEDIFMGILRLFCLRYDSETDGLVSPESAKWGVYRGTINCISHQDIVDKRKIKIKNFDSVLFIINIVQDLRKKGY